MLKVAKSISLSEFYRREQNSLAYFLKLISSCSRYIIRFPTKKVIVFSKSPPHPPEYKLLTVFYHNYHNFKEKQDIHNQGKSISLDLNAKPLYRGPRVIMLRKS